MEHASGKAEELMKPLSWSFMVFTLVTAMAFGIKSEKAAATTTTPAPGTEGSQTTAGTTQTTTETSQTQAGSNKSITDGTQSAQATNQPSSTNNHTPANQSTTGQTPDSNQPTAQSNSSRGSSNTQS